MRYLLRSAFFAQSIFVFVDIVQAEDVEFFGAQTKIESEGDTESRSSTAR